MISWFIFVGLVTATLGGDCEPEPTTPPCGLNEVYSEKKFVCPPQSCESIYTTYLCAQGEPEPGCNCINGYLRNADNVCIPSEQCDIPGGAPVPVNVRPEPSPPPLTKGCNGDPNAEFRSCRGCDGSCDNPNPICTAQCRPGGCQCKRGYVRHNGKCILPKHCPAKRCNDANEVFRDCTSCEGSCDNASPICAAVCGPPGCQCKSGYVRSNGKCILKENCPVETGCKGDPNAILKICPNPCPATCDNPNPTGPCPRLCLQTGCECKKGYVLSADGKCILPDNCPAKSCNGPNEVFRDCTSCEGSCDNPSPICAAVCGPPGCQCVSGFVRSNGKCILQRNCPAKRCNFPNEVFRDCTSCEGSCDNPSPICAAVCGPPGCQCESGYVRSNGKCILQKNCPAKRCKGPNEEFRDCRSCEGSCENPNPICTTICRSPGCQCKSGYVRSNGKCILQENCPAKSCNGPNEVFRDCTSCEGSCDNPSPICAAVCGPPGCQCESGYVRSNGKCILQKNCPAKRCKGPNEEFRDCRSCEGSCENPNPICTTICRSPGCQCKSGYVRSNGKCILQENCPAKSCNGPNEVFRDCTSCEGSCDNPSPICAAVCGPPGCQCESGYVRSNGKCILQKNCPAKRCKGPNEEFRDCRSCEGSCENPNPICTTVCRSPGCQCKSGYVRSNGKCILQENCPASTLPLCGENEIATKNRTICPPQSCEIIYTTYFCEPQPVEPGCDCIDGYLRNSDGVCIPNYECPPPAPVLPECGQNEIATNNRTICPPQSCDILYTTYACEPQPEEPGCDCIEGYLRNADGVCISNDKCPGPEPPQACGYNEVFTTNKIFCPPETCETLYRPAYPCAPPPPNPSSGCVCLANHLRNSSGICIPKEQCPPPSTDKPPQACGINEVFTLNKISCPPETCTTLYQPPYPCANPKLLPKKPGCKCLPGYLRNSDGVCIPKEQCPPPSTDKPSQACGVNEVYTLNKILCPPETCITLYQPPYPCPNPRAQPITPGCKCLPGHLRNSNGVCIPKEQCPPPSTDKPIQACGYNEVFTTNKIFCPPETCETLYRPAYPCAPPPPNPSSGCVCVANHLRNSSGICIPKEQCTVPKNVNCAENEVYLESAPTCPPDSCDTLYVAYDCAAPPEGIIPPPGCRCKNSYLRNSKGICIPQDQCPPLQMSPKCPIPRKCRPTCSVPNPPNCPKTEPATSNIDDCQCQGGYVLSEETGKCVRVEDCPRQKSCNGDPHAVIRACPLPCPPTCANPDNKRCNKGCLPVGCVCDSGYILSKENGKCVLPDTCPGGNPCGINSTFVDCAFVCPNEAYCPREEGVKFACNAPPYPCPPGCVCKENYKKLNGDGRCVLKSDCPKLDCNDPNAEVTKCPNPCPATCENPEPGVCNKLCLSTGCQCKPGYLLSKGKCVLPKDCPGGVSCPANEQYVFCKVDCPNSFCPENDSRAIIMCDPPFPCPSGCSCKAGYLRKSQKDKRCIDASKCPPVKCSRPNEVWSPSPPNCLAERCEDYITPPGPCNKPYRDYTPKCICKKGYYRNSDDVCVPAQECVPKCPIAPRCRPTCAVPNPAKCPVVEPATSNVDGCQCKEGYILEKEGGKCIKYEDCPPQNSCNGDPNAIITACPWACQPTCKNPEAAICRANCMPVGCNCKPGYIRSKENGKCILPDTCPGGNPCGKNGVFLECGFRCPSQYCPEDDSGVKIACKPGRPCPPGCGCKDNYKRLGYKNETCVLAADCPIIQCTRPNEVWSRCPSDCLAESCDNVNDPQPVCDTPLCDPKCVCQQGYYRNGAGECVPAKDCPGYNPCGSSCTPTCANPNPPNCDSSPASTCCESGYVLSEKGGKCIKIEDCPRNGCNGDPNAIVKQCPAPCPSTCDSPNAFPCRKACRVIGCECAPGYLFNKDGKCVLPNECPGGNPCRENERFVTCKVPCPTDYCPTSDTRAVVACAPPFPCLSGCICNLNYRRKSVDDDRCIVASDCPPVQCTRQNEVWSRCPSDCASEYCDAVDQPPVVCNTLVLNCQPKCVCKKDYFRNSTTDICISADECRQSTNPPDCDE